MCPKSLGRVGTRWQLSQSMRCDVCAPPIDPESDNSSRYLLNPDRIEKFGHLTSRIRPKRPSAQENPHDNNASIEV